MKKFLRLLSVSLVGVLCCFALAGCNKTNDLSAKDAEEMLNDMAVKNEQVNFLEVSSTLNMVKNGVAENTSSVCKTTKNENKYYGGENSYPPISAYGTINKNGVNTEYYIGNPLINNQGYSDSKICNMFKNWQADEDKPRYGESILLNSSVELQAAIRSYGMYEYKNKIKDILDKHTNDQLIDFKVSGIENLKKKEFVNNKLTVTASYLLSGKLYNFKAEITIEKVSVTLQSELTSSKMITGMQITETAQNYSYTLNVGINYSPATIVMPMEGSWVEFV